MRGHSHRSSLPIHNMHELSHVDYAHFSSLHKMRNFNVEIPTVGLAHAYYAVGIPTYLMRILFPCIKCAFYVWAFPPWVCPCIICVGCLTYIMRFFPVHKMSIFKCLFPLWVCPCIICVGFPHA